MTIYLISFATKDFKKSQAVLTKSAKNFGVEKVISFDLNDLIKTDFYKKNIKIFSQKRGMGYWLWKPFFIYKTLKKIKTGDILVYSDAGMEIISSIDPLLKIVDKNEVVLFSNDEFKNKIYTKRDCFVLMGCDSTKYWNTFQIQASFQVYRKSKGSLKFVKNWLDYCTDSRILTDSENEFGRNFSCFKDHRHDQSVLSLLAIKYNIEIFRDPSQWGNFSKPKNLRILGEFLHKPYSINPFYNSPYNQLTFQNRNRLVGLSWKRKLHSLILGLLSFNN